MKQEKSCGALLFRIKEEPQVLMIRQVQGHWCFPKGHVEKDETEEETALREIREETGLKASINNGFRETLGYSPKEGVYKEVGYYAGTVKGGKKKVQEEELSEIRWVNFEKARELVTYANDAEMFEKAVRYFEEHIEEFE